MSKVHTTGNGKLKKEFKPKNITNKRIQNNIANINWEWESSSSYIYDGKVGKKKMTYKNIIYSMEVIIKNLQLKKLYKNSCL